MQIDKIAIGKNVPHDVNVLVEVPIGGEAHLRRLLKSYATYYNEARTHRSLNKDSPISRPVHHTGRIISHPVLSGLHHQYSRI